MQKIANENKQFYLEDKEALETRVYESICSLEEYLVQYNLQHLQAECMKKWNRLWEIGKSYWMFPTEEDMKQLVDEEYKKYAGDTKTVSMESHTGSWNKEI